jgi:hypothetical protein
MSRRSPSPAKEAGGLPPHRLVSLSADGDRVAALSSGRSRSGKELWIAEHWKLRDGEVLSIMVFYHNTAPLMPNASAPAQFNREASS